MKTFKNLDSLARHLSKQSFSNFLELNINEKKKYFENLGLSFKADDFTYSPKENMIITNIKNPFTGKVLRIKTTLRNPLKNICKIYGRIHFRKNIQNPEDIFLFVPEYMGSKTVAVKSDLGGLPIQSVKSAENEKRRMKEECIRRAEEKRKEVIAHQK